jgi:hypothetical protein
MKQERKINFKHHGKNKLRSPKINVDGIEKCLLMNTTQTYILA